MKAKPTSILKDIEHNPDLVVGHKYNGYSERLVVKDGVIRLFNRSGSEQTQNVPHLTSIPVSASMDLIIAGEGLAPDGRLEGAKSIFGSGPDHSIKWQAEHGLAGFAAVNITRYKGEDLSDVPFGDRLFALTEAVVELKILGLVKMWQEPLVEHDKEYYFEEIVSLGGEGVVVKSLSGLEKDWYKVKRVHSWDAVVMGFTEGKGKYSKVIGAIRYGFYDYNGNLQETGKCSGMTDAERAMFASSPESFVGRVIEIKGQELGSRGGIVFPRFVRIRDDKLPTDCLLPSL